MAKVFARRWVAILAGACLVIGGAVAGSGGPVLAAGLVITTTDDHDDGTCDADCTLREAINAANADSDATVIDFADGVTGTIQLGSGLPDISTDMTINGPGARKLTVHRNSGGDYRVFVIDAGTVAISGLTISGGGNDVTGAGVANAAPGDLTLTEVTITGNTAASGANIRQGGGIYNSGTLTVQRSLMKNNTAYTSGGGIYNLGTLNVYNTTITGNSVTFSDGKGGGIFNDVGGNVTLDSNTITDNHADGQVNSSRGGGIENNGSTVTVTNTIIANNTDGFGRPNVSGTFQDGGHNLVENTTGSSGFTDPSDVIGQDPDLGSLDNNGGPTNTELPSTSSPALDVGDTTLVTDQRGVDRPQNSIDDIGAVERRQCALLDPLVVTTTAESNVVDDCVTSLREAMTYANNNAGADTITFDIPGSGVHTIKPTSALPAITEQVTINGYSQTGASPATVNADAVIDVEVDGSDAGGGVDGFDITGDSSTIKGLAITHWRNGVVLETGGSHDNVISGNFIGLDASGTKAKNTQDGVLIESDAHANTVGGTSESKRNVLSGNGANGVEVTGSSTVNNLIQGNYIGTNVHGDAAIANSSDGVLGEANAAPTPIKDNVISGNGLHGIEINDLHAVSQISGNLIGTNAAGTAALGNTDDGINMVNQGGYVVSNDVISGNGGDGIELGSGTGGVVIQNNDIGTGVGGTGNLGNDGNGILDIGGLFHTIGSSHPDQGFGNVIAHNGLAGIFENGQFHNPFYDNSIFDNGGLGIDLGPVSGPTANDPDDADGGPNNGQNFPVITGVTLTGTGATVNGTLDSTATTTFDLQFFSNQSADPSGYGEGETYLGSDQVTTDGNGHASFASSVSAPVGFEISATATDDAVAGGTSEFSSAFHIPHADVSVAKSAPRVVQVGKPFAYVLTVRNAGPDNAANVVVRDNLPSGLTYVDGGSSQACDANTATSDDNDVICRLGTVRNGASRRVVIEAEANVGGVVANVATVSSRTADSNAANNHSDTVKSSARYPFEWVSPTVARPGVNKAHAGSIVRIHFSLGGNFGLDILSENSPFQQPYVSCPPGRLRPGTRASAMAAGSGLSYNASTDVYTFSWQTKSNWYPNSACRQFQLVLKDHVVHRLDVQLTQPAAAPPGNRGR